jgi:GTP-binding nuclear protein Ran
MTAVNGDLVNALSVIRQLFTQGHIDEPRRTLLKDLVVQRNDALLGALELYSISFELADLLDSIDVLLQQYTNLNLPPLPLLTAAPDAAAPTWSQPVAPAPASAASFGPLATFKVVIAGDGAVGKSCFVRRALGRPFETNYTPTLGVEVHPLLLKTTKGNIVLNLWDLAGEEKFGGLRDGYYIGAQAALLVFSVTDRKSYKSVPMWHRDVCRVAESVPMVLVGTKNDAVGERRVSPKHILFHRKKNLRYVEFSAKRTVREQLLRPFWLLARSLINDQTLELLDDSGQKINFDIKRTDDDADDDDNEEEEDDDADAAESKAEIPLYCTEVSAANPLFAPAPMAAPAAFNDFEGFSFAAPMAAPSAFEF